MVSVLLIEPVGKFQRDCTAFAPAHLFPAFIKHVHTSNENSKAQRVGYMLIM